MRAKEGWRCARAVAQTRQARSPARLRERLFQVFRMTAGLGNAVFVGSKNANRMHWLCRQPLTPFEAIENFSEKHYILKQGFAVGG
jgi:hypothetical protein